MSLGKVHLLHRRRAMKFNHLCKISLAFLLSLTVLPFSAAVHAEEPQEPEITEDAELLNADIPNTAAYFPDANFRNYLTQYVDSNGDGILSQAERDKTTALHLNGRAIKDVTGIKYFPNITTLWVDTNSISKLDLSGNTKIKVLHAYHTDLTALDVSMCPDLRELWCFNNFKMEVLNMRNCKNLIVLEAYRCKMNILDLTDNPLLIATYQYGTKTPYNDGPHGDSVQYMEAGGELWIDSAVQVKTKLAPPKSIKIDQGNMNLPYAPYMGLPAGWGKLTVTIKPDNATENNVFWISLDPSVVTVDSEGTIVAQKAGTAEIKVRTGQTGSISDTITVTVQERPLIHKFVARLYMIALDRAADMGGFNSWVNKLTSKKITAAEAVRGFFLSAEMTKKNLSDDEFVERCYKVMFDRAGDPKGKKDWLEKLKNGVSRTYVVKGFIDSVEFANTCKKFGVTQGTIGVTEPRDQNYGITSFVARCYVYVLDRKFDVKGLNDWCAKILAAKNRKQAAIDMASNGFFHSPEYLKKNTTDEQYVTSLYWTFLGRKPDANGFKDWVNQLKNGTSRDTVLYGFAYSAEFAKLMASYGIS